MENENMMGLIVIVLIGIGIIAGLGVILAGYGIYLNDQMRRKPVKKTNEE